MNNFSNRGKVVAIEKCISQGVNLCDYKTVNERINKNYHKAIVNISACVENRFEEVHNATFFHHLVPLLEVQTWPKAINNVWEEFAAELSSTLTELLEKNGCKHDKTLNKWIYPKKIHTANHSKSLKDQVFGDTEN